MNKNSVMLVLQIKLYDVIVLLEGNDPPWFYRLSAALGWIRFLAGLQTNYSDVTLESLEERLEIQPIFVRTFTEDILRWFHYPHNENRCFWSISLQTWLNMKGKYIISGPSTMAAFISLSLFGVGVNNEQIRMVLSLHFLCLSQPLTRFLYLIPCTDDDSEISFSFCLPPHSDKCTHQLGPWGQAL